MVTLPEVPKPGGFLALVAHDVATDALSRMSEPARAHTTAQDMSTDTLPGVLTPAQDASMALDTLPGVPTRHVSMDALPEATQATPQTPVPEHHIPLTTSNTSYPLRSRFRLDPAGLITPRTVSWVEQTVVDLSGDDRETEDLRDEATLSEGTGGHQEEEAPQRVLIEPQADSPVPQTIQVAPQAPLAVAPPPTPSHGRVAEQDDRSSGHAVSGILQSLLTKGNGVCPRDDIVSVAMYIRTLQTKLHQSDTENTLMDQVIRAQRTTTHTLFQRLNTERNRADALETSLSLLRSEVDNEHNNRLAIQQCMDEDLQVGYIRNRGFGVRG